MKKVLKKSLIHVAKSFAYAVVFAFLLLGIVSVMSDSYAATGYEFFVAWSAFVGLLLMYPYPEETQKTSV